MEGPGIEPRWEARISAHVQTGPGAHPASYIKGNGSFPGVMRPGRRVDHLTPSSAEAKETVTTPPLGLRDQIYGDLHLLALL